MSQIHDREKNIFINNFKQKKRLEGIRNFRIMSWKSLFGLEAPQKEYWDYVSQEIIDKNLKLYDE